MEAEESFFHSKLVLQCQFQRCNARSWLEGGAGQHGVRYELEIGHVVPTSWRCSASSRPISSLVTLFCLRFSSKYLGSTPIFLFVLANVKTYKNTQTNIKILKMMREPTKMSKENKLIKSTYHVVDGTFSLTQSTRRDRGRPSFLHCDSVTIT